jgi:hypothetical protein
MWNTCAWMAVTVEMDYWKTREQRCGMDSTDQGRDEWQPFANTVP